MESFQLRVTGLKNEGKLDLFEKKERVQDFHTKCNSDSLESLFGFLILSCFLMNYHFPINRPRAIKKGAHR